MKKYLFLVLLGLTTMSFACDKCNCKYLFDIVIENNTAFDCKLISQSIGSGMIYTNKLPLNIASGFQSDPYTFEYNLSDRKTDVTLSFQCGDDRFITIKSQRTIERRFLSTLEKINGTVTSASNLDATFVGKESKCNIPTSASIYWSLK